MNELKIIIETRFPHPEDKCQECGRDNITWFTPSELWNKVIGDSNGILCPVCFGKRAEKLFPNAVFKIEIES